MDLNLSYNTVCCLRDYAEKALECCIGGETVLTMPCDNLQIEHDIIQEHIDMLNELLEVDNW